ncbi:enhanced serine sensitivity protein SseB C-terminal domain-containing protein [Loigolactobacillus backii]|uniref:Uncharacterized protein n=1 Tax=Loigolactobacillus backii TaxID=375175 RepID=A0A192H4S6_9LACO|nr:enhanced serine sensitivity protein SseB C-terminal domain-containing protein [Loigolactobacillus backii]ANK59911.1 hypothetical protein AYR52_06340 [Loigolactobacillus backii]ANK63248.1 hypothetical protein AYR53_11010 [Loigolactobacillus backii]ANK64846.1 hypothetical protein AYR54_06025 [Loigolactobacillus backii]ANK66707.1 hypothetical protein AYR55_02730 [Loigolactobacillus backii]ANK69746.1 hypothetical protein AYR56_05995 [Loigolactobacillus backii]
MSLFDVFKKKKTNQQGLTKPTTNPQLEQYFRLLRSKPRDEAGLIEQIFRYIALNGRFLVVIATEAEINEQTTMLTMKKDEKFSFPLLTNTANETMLPVFSNWDELRKWQKRPSDKALVVDFEDIATMVLEGTDAGFSLDPFTENFVVYRQQVKHMHDQKNIEQHGHVTQVIKKDAAVEIGEPADYPTEMVAELAAQLPAIKEVKAVWLRWWVRDDEGSYLLLLNYTGNRAQLYPKIGKIVTPYLRGHYIDIMESQSFSDVIEKVEPIYTRR